VNQKGHFNARNDVDAIVSLAHVKGSASNGDDTSKEAKKKHVMYASSAQLFVVLFMRSPFHRASTTANDWNDTYNGPCRKSRFS